MTLKLTLKPGEKFFVGNAEIDIRCDSISIIFIEGTAPVLRSEDHIDEVDAVTTAQKLQYVVQEMYLSDSIDAHQTEYFALAKALIDEQPEMSELIAEANLLLIKGATYKAIKLLKCLTAPELSLTRSRFSPLAPRLAAAR